MPDWFDVWLNAQNCDKIVDKTHRRFALHPKDILIYAISWNTWPLEGFLRFYRRISYWDIWLFCSIKWWTVPTHKIFKRKALTQSAEIGCTESNSNYSLLGYITISPLIPTPISSFISFAPITRDSQSYLLGTCLEAKASIVGRYCLLSFSVNLFRCHHHRTD